MSIEDKLHFKWSGISGKETQKDVTTSHTISMSNPLTASPHTCKKISGYFDLVESKDWQITFTADIKVSVIGSVLQDDCIIDQNFHIDNTYAII